MYWMTNLLSCVTDYRGMWTWFGNTLSPYYEGNNVGEMVADDRFILHSLPYWHFGADGTGNLMDWNNFQQVTAICHKMTPVYLVGSPVTKYKI